MSLANPDTWATLYAVAAVAYIVNRVVLLATSQRDQAAVFGVELPFPMPKALYLAAVIAGLLLAGVTWPVGVVRWFLHRKGQKP